MQFISIYIINLELKVLRCNYQDHRAAKLVIQGYICTYIYWILADIT